MKIVISLVLSLCLIIYSNSDVSANSERIVQSICDYTKANNRSKIRKKLKQARLKLRKVYPTIKCEGQSLHAYAIANNASEVVKFIETKVKKEKL
jgi:hypothetical protein